jgi:squalene-hopene/tetraprenyl-beta-curcumene cyclase
MSTSRTRTARTAAKAEARPEILSHSLARVKDSPQLDRSIAAARDALIAVQHAQGYWLFELEADCTIPAEYILMMHFLAEIDASLEVKIAAYLRARQAEHGGWPLYHGGDLDLSCTVKAYYALKLVGDDPNAAHMQRARAAILQRGGAARANVFTRIALALFGQLPWRGVPYIPVEIMLLPRWFPFHLDRVSYWSRTVMVPLLILCTRKPVARNPRNASCSRLPPRRSVTISAAAASAQAFCRSCSWCSIVSAAWSIRWCPVPCARTPLGARKRGSSIG